MDKRISNVVVVGGGTAGWITASLIAATQGRVGVTLVESPDIPIIGVGEGTWPSMRATLKTIGVDETELVRNCDASFKQGTEFVAWAENDARSRYYHPFSLPAEYPSLPLADYWLAHPGGTSFAEFVTPQAQVIEAGLAPKQASMPAYSFAVNYGYHFDAGKFAGLLHRHAVDKLGVRYVSGNVIGIDSDGEDIAAVRLDTGESVRGDLFVDCTGQKSLLLGEHFGVGFESVRDVLFNDAAIAVQVPHERPTDPIASVTRATAAGSGWVWDIALQNRRGIGYVHSTAHTDEDAAMKTIREYVREQFPATRVEELTFRRIPFEPGYRREFWVNNCVAVGLSGGFIEPLEASALALIEQAATILARQFPADREIMAVVAKRFNEKMLYNWQRVIEFLKLHYVLSSRTDTPYWSDCRDARYCPVELADKLVLWQQQAPRYDDVPRVDELFPAASYQYVLYGMGFRPKYAPEAGNDAAERQRVDKALHETRERARQLRNGLPSNRSLLDELTSLPGVA